MLIPLGSVTTRRLAILTGAGLLGGDVLRRAAGTPGDLLPRPRRISTVEALQLAPLRTAGLRGALVTWDGQLEDDARLVTNIARTAASYGAHIRTRARVLSASGTQVELRDELTGETTTVTARTVHQRRRSLGRRPGARGDAAPQSRDPPGPAGLEHPGSAQLGLRPDPRDHRPLHQRAAAAGRHDLHRAHRRAGRRRHPRRTRALRARDRVPAGRGLGCVRAAAAPSDVVGAYAGLRPLLSAGDASGTTSDLSRRHAVLTSTTGVITIVGGKLDDVPPNGRGRGRRGGRPRRSGRPAVPHHRAAPARRRSAGAARRARGAGPAGPPLRHRRPAGARTARAASGLGDEELLAPVAEGVPVTLAELIFGVTDEGAADVDDLLDRRTRVGLIPADRALAVPAAERALRIGSRALR